MAENFKLKLLTSFLSSTRNFPVHSWICHFTSTCLNWEICQMMKLDSPHHEVLLGVSMHI